MEAFGALLFVLIQMYSFVILARVLLSWVQLDPSSPIVRTIYDLTEPVLAPVRNLLPPASGFDFSPIVVMILLYVLMQFIAAAFGG